MRPRQPDGKEHWAIEARCGDCGPWHSLHLTNAETAAWELALDRVFDAWDVPLRRPITEAGLGHEMDRLRSHR